MNDKRRKKLSGADSHLEAALLIASAVLDEETDCLNNMPENLEGSERYEKIEDAVSKLEDLVQGIEDLKDLLYEASA